MVLPLSSWPNQLLEDLNLFACLPVGPFKHHSVAPQQFANRCSNALSTTAGVLLSCWSYLHPFTASRWLLVMPAELDLRSRLIAVERNTDPASWGDVIVTAS